MHDEQEVVSTDGQKKTLIEKLFSIQSGVSYLQKTSKGKDYNYVSSSQTLGVIRELMDRERVLLVPSVHECVFWPKEKLGGAMHLTEMKMHFEWVNADNPNERWGIPWYGQGSDMHEKGCGKAMTYGEKTFLLKFFHVATDGMDPDSFQERVEKTAAQAAVARLTDTEPNPIKKPVTPERVADMFEIPEANRPADISKAPEAEQVAAKKATLHQWMARDGYTTEEERRFFKFVTHGKKDLTPADLDRFIEGYDAYKLSFDNLIMKKEQK